jgi:hypothetical protein
MNQTVSRKIRRVHLIFKTHLDIGFTDLSKRVVQNYFECYIPGAIRVARELREAGGRENFIWTVGSWLVYEYLEQASARNVKEMERAITAGDIAWHGLPFTTHTELMPPWLFKSAIGCSKDLDRRFGRTTIAAKMTDVPGHTRGIVSILADAGIQYLHIGVNPASAIPAVPKLNLWSNESSGDEIILHYQGVYGAADQIPETGEAIFFAHTGDNQGPQSIETVREVYRQTRLKYPGAEIQASTLDRFAQSLLPLKSSLPRLTCEIGDTWIRGVATDSTKTRRFLELCRVGERGLAEHPALGRDPRFKSMTRRLMLVAEHTWGLDEKTHLQDWSHYEKTVFVRARSGANFRKMEASWKEQREYLVEAVKALGQLPLKKDAQAALTRVEPTAPDLRGLKELSLSSGEVGIEGDRLRIILDTTTGGIRSIRDGQTGRQWKSGVLPIAGFRYEVFSKKNFSRYLRQYGRDLALHRSWAVPDITKPGLNPKVPHEWFLPKVRRILVGDRGTGRRFVVEMGMSTRATKKFGAPAQIFLEGGMSDEKDGRIDLGLTWFKKSAIRWPEALWMTFGFRLPDPKGWRLDKMEEWISPLDVIHRGSRSLHAVGTGGIEYRDNSGSLKLQPLDAPLISPGKPNILDFNDQLPDLRRGVQSLLQCNLWGTNFPMWFEDNGLFRYSLTVGEY